MKKASVSGLTFVAALAFAAAHAFTPAPAFAAEANAAGLDPAAANGPAVEGAPTDGPVVLFLTREEHEKRIARQPLARPSSSPDLVYHGGKILATAHTYAIFWGTGWSSTSLLADKDTGLDAFYAGFSGSTYAGTNTEYTDGLGVHVGSATSHLGHTFDLSPGPTRAPKTSAILAEVCKIASTAGQPAPDADGSSYYAVYTDLPRGHAGYCAWHSYGTCNGSPVQFAFFFDLDGDAGCDPQDTSTSHSQGLAALANVSGHELSEAVTDPALDAWYDPKGAENSDKCAWAFNSPFVTLSNGSEFKVQGNWSNAAFDAGTGYPNRSGQLGCLDGR